MKIFQSAALALLLALAMSVCAWADETPADAERFTYDPLGQPGEEVTLLEGSFPLAVTGSDVSYGDAIQRAYPQVYAIYQTIDSVMAQAVQGRVADTTWQFSDGSTMTGYLVNFTFSDSENVLDALYLAVAAYINDHPFESASLTGSFGRGISSNGSYRLLLERMSGAADRYFQLDNAAKIFAQMYKNDGMETADIVEQYRYIHDFLCEELWYNDDAAADKLTGDAAEDAHNAYGALVALGKDDSEQGHVVCEGYADAYLLLCQRVGLPCTVVIGEGLSGTSFTGYSNHIWNAVPINGLWYAVDVTWDDVDGDYTFSTETVPGDTVYYSFCEYDYFLDNRHFMADSGLTQNHKDYNQNSYGNTAGTMSAPALATGYYVTDRTARSGVCVLYGAEGAETAEMSSAMAVVNGLFPNATDVTVILTQDTVMDRLWTVKDDQTLRIVSGVEGGVTLSRENDPDALFTVSSRATLLLDNLTLDGREILQTGALVTGLSERTEEGLNRSLVLLEDVTVTGGGDGGIGSSGIVAVAGKCIVDGNTGFNLSLGEGAFIFVYAPLETGSHIGLTSAGWAPVMPLNYQWTEADRACFVSDTEGETVVYSTQLDSLYLGVDRTLTGSSGVTLDFVTAPSAQAAAGQTVTLTNTGTDTRTITVYEAFYDENGRMLSITLVKDGTLEAGKSVDFTLAQADEEAESGTLFVLENGSPLLQAAAF